MKKNLKSVISLLFIFSSYFAFSQGAVIKGEVNTTSIVNPEGDTPFWFWANKLGQIPASSTFLQTGEISMDLNYKLNEKNSLLAGYRFFGVKGTEYENLEFTELFAGFKFHKFKLMLGAKTDSTILSGLSTCNGNFLNSRNARPYPSVSLASDGFIKIGRKNFYMAGKWEEAILYDERVIDKPRLHHKNVFFRFGNRNKSQFEFGVDHYAFWGGNSEAYGIQPDGFTDYLRAIFALKGGSEHYMGDQMNVAGNSLGQYFFIFRKDWKKLNFEARVVHPFEDKSGMVMFNGIDNLYSFYFNFKEKRFIQHFLLEFIYSKQQSGDDIQNGKHVHTNGRDNYMSHKVYGPFVYQEQILGIPLVLYFKNSQGIAEGIMNNRIMAFHSGVDGILLRNFKWKVLLTFSQNFGTHWTPYSEVKNQFSGLGEIGYSSSGFPVYIKAKMAFDQGYNLHENNYRNGGLQLVIGKVF